MFESCLRNYLKSLMGIRLFLLKTLPNFIENTPELGEQFIRNNPLKIRLFC